MKTQIKSDKYAVYILRTSSNTLYVGQSKNLEKRLEKHKTKKGGAKYMAYFKSFKLVYQEFHPTRSLALKREYEIKSWRKKDKETFILAGNKSV